LDVDVQNALSMKHFHGVAVENTYAYSLKSRIGKAGAMHMPRFGMMASFDLLR
jgi:hypothetical protein